MQNMNGKTALGLDSNIGALICYVGNLVCYLGLVYSIIVLVTDKTNKLARFHAFQSILLTVLALVIIIPTYIVMVVTAISGSTIGSLIGMLAFIIVLVVGLAMFVFTILSAIKAFQGEIYKIPVIGNYADQWSN